MKLSDYVVEFLRARGVQTVFYLAGGGMMHLLDSLGTSEIDAVALLHEQAVAIACESYASTKGAPGAAFVTTGPGGTNAVTGTLAAYLDSVPCFFVSGQVKTADLKSRYGVRSLGSQEAGIVEIVSSITKYAVMVRDPERIRYEMERAWHMMTSGRMGPVWVDIPLDVQSAQIVPDALPGYVAADAPPGADVGAIISAISAARRPVIIAGNGLARCRDAFGKLGALLQIPIIPTWKAMDLVSVCDPLYAGKVGGMGDRAGNLTMQNADLLLCLGSRLDFSITGYDRTQWAPAAAKIVVEIEAAEIAKLEAAAGVVPVSADVAAVCDALLARRDEIAVRDISEWRAQIARWQERYPIITRDKCTSADGRLTTYAFVDALSRTLPADAHIAPCSAGTTAEIFFQAFAAKRGQVIRSNHGLGSMGFEIPAAIGMCIANGRQPVVCIAGDGGMQLNIQELAIIRGLGLPITIFVINNGGYASIRNMQNNHFGGRHIGCDASVGLFLPNISLLAAAYGFDYFLADAPQRLEHTIAAALQTTAPALCEIVVDAECLVTPRTATYVMPDGSLQSSPLHNQFPFLDDDEVRGNMLI